MLISKIVDNIFFIGTLPLFSSTNKEKNMHYKKTIKIYFSSSWKEAWQIPWTRYAAGNDLACLLLQIQSEDVKGRDSHWSKASPGRSSRERQQGRENAPGVLRHQEKVFLHGDEGRVGA